MTEMIAAMICEKDSILEGIKYVECVDGSMTLLVMTGEGIYAARDRYGRTPLVIGQKEEPIVCLLKVMHILILVSEIIKSLVLRDCICNTGESRSLK